MVTMIQERTSSFLYNALENKLAEKLLAFEYVAHKFCEWYKEHRYSDPHGNDLSKLKVLKLLFFLTASTTNEKNEGLLSIFNNFHAMPYGHVESDIYRFISDLDSVKIDSSKTICLPVQDDHFKKINGKLGELDIAVNKLKAISPNLIVYSGMSLVELSHLYKSWTSIFNLARSFNKYSLAIPSEAIMSEQKLLKLELIENLYFRS